jgi:tetratricopeptide (TPR) repeat protein
LYLIGLLQEKRGNLREAEMNFRMSQQYAPRNIETTIALANIYSLEKKHPEALALVYRALKSKDDDPTLNNAYVSTLLAAGKYAEVSHIIKTRIDKDPDNLELINLLTQYFLVKKDTQRAESCFKRIEHLDPLYDKHFRDCGLLLCGTGDYENAEKYLEEYLITNPKDFTVLFELATLYKKKQEYQKALDLYKQILESDPKNLRAHINVSRINGTDSVPLETEADFEDDPYQQSLDFNGPSPDFDDVSKEISLAAEESPVKKEEPQIENEEFDFSQLVALTDEDPTIDHSVFDALNIMDSFEEEIKPEDDLAGMTMLDEPLEFEPEPDRYNPLAGNSGGRGRYFPQEEDVLDLGQMQPPARPVSAPQQRSEPQPQVSAEDYAPPQQAQQQAPVTPQAPPQWQQQAPQPPAQSQSAQTSFTPPHAPEPRVESPPSSRARAPSPVDDFEYPWEDDFDGITQDDVENLFTAEEVEDRRDTDRRKQQAPRVPERRATERRASNAPRQRKSREPEYAYEPEQRRDYNSPRSSQDAQSMPDIELPIDDELGQRRGAKNRTEPEIEEYEIDLPNVDESESFGAAQSDEQSSESDELALPSETETNSADKDSSDI